MQTGSEKKYSNDEITVIWKKDLCVHSANCVRGLPDVFNTNASPWVNVDKASAKVIKQVVDKCPSGALSYEGQAKVNEEPKTELSITANGPIIVSGQFEIKDTNGEVIPNVDKAALCRCGHSQNKPFCDGSHKSENFVG